MARRRYISTEISVDKTVNKLANQYGLGAVLLYTWMIPHAEDNRSITADPEEILLTVIPGFRNVSVEDVTKIVKAMVEIGLLVSNDDKLYFPESFYKYQSYIPENKRFFDNENAKRRKTPKNTVSPSPSPSPSININDDFETLWKLYPRKEGKGQVSPTQKEKIFKIGIEEMTRAVQRFITAKKDTEKKFLPYGSTFFNSGYVDYLDANFTEPEKTDDGTVLW